MPIRLLAIDMDGTLLTSERKVHPAAARAIHRAMSKGVIVVLASGRTRPSMAPFLQEMSLDTPLICSNGAYILGAGGTDIAHWSVPHPVFDAVWAYVSQTKAKINLYTRTQLVLLKETDYHAEYARRENTTMPAHIVGAKDVRDLELCKILIKDQNDELLTHRRELAPIVEQLGGKTTESEPNHIEFVPAGVSKAAALKTLCSHLGIAREETAAIGDYLNDVEMLSWVGLSGAVRSCDPCLLTVADHIVATNDDGGVAEFIDSHVLSGQ